MMTLLPLATGVTEITWFLTVPCSPLSLSTYTHLFPTTSGKNAAAPLPVDTELADPELADPELADPELADPELANPELAGLELVAPELADPELADPELADPELAALAAGWPDEEDAVEPEVLPQPARISPEAAAAASMPAAGVPVVKPDLFISCLGLGARSRKGAAGRPGMASGAGR
jgi:hypothetical protein